LSKLSKMNQSKEKRERLGGTGGHALSMEDRMRLDRSQYAPESMLGTSLASAGTARVGSDLKKGVRDDGDLGNASDRKSLSLDDLLGGGLDDLSGGQGEHVDMDPKGSKAESRISDREARENLRKLLADKASQAIAAPLKNVEQEKIEKEVAFDATKKQVSRWTGIVKSMREAPQLKFPLREEPRLTLSTSTLVSKFTPTSDLEKDFSVLLDKYGMGSEKEIKEKEKQALEDENITEEVRDDRVKQLRKTRSLMFYHEIKLKRIKKIKSRTYRKLAKKRKEKQKLSLAELEELDPDLAEAEKKKIEAKRIQERMSLRHKNTSKWVKRQLKLAKNNPALRGVQQAIGQQLNIGDELRRKMEGGYDSSTERDNSDLGGGEEEDDLAAMMDDAESGGPDGDGDADKIHSAENKKSAAEKLQQIRILQQSLKKGIEADKPKKGLLSMKFMQRAMEKRAKAAAELLDDFKNEIEGPGKHTGSNVDFFEEDDRESFSFGTQFGDTKSDSNDDGHDGHDAGDAFDLFAAPVSSGCTKLSSHGTLEVEVDEVTDEAHQVDQSSGRSSGPKYGSKPKSKSIALKLRSSRSRVKEGGAKTETDHQERGAGTGGNNADEFAAFQTSAKEGSDMTANAKASGKSDRERNVQQGDPEPYEQPNPWVSDSTRRHQLPASHAHDARNNMRKTTKNKKSEAKGKRGDAESFEDGTFEEEGEESEESDINVEKAMQVDGSERSNRLILDQAEAVERAFGVDADAEKEFANEKFATENPEFGKEEINTLPGWGSWGGEGVRKSRPKSKRSKGDNNSSTVGEAEKKQKKRKGPNHVIVNTKRNKKAKKYSVPHIPYPFTSKRQYEMSLRQPLGRDWNTLKSYQAMTKPEVITKAGAIINPISVKELKRHETAEKQRKAGANAAANRNGGGKRKKRKQKNKS